MRPTRCAAFSLSIVLSVSAAHAADPGGPLPSTPPSAAHLREARDLFAAASKDEAAQRWTDALEKLRRVAQIKVTASVRYHTAFCEEKLGRTGSALAHYTEARDAADRERNKAVEGLLTPLFLSDLRARVPTLTLNVPVDVPGAEVTLDGHRQPPESWGLAVPLDPGVHRVEARAPEREAFTRELILSERDAPVLDVHLPRLAASPPAPEPAPPPVTPPAPPAAPIAVTSPPPRDASAPRASSAPPPRAARPVGLAVATTIGAALLAGGGVGAFILAGNDQSSGGRACLARTTGDCDDLKTPVRTWDAVALGAWLGAAALTTTAIVLWASPRATADVRLGVSASQLRVEGTF